MDAILITGNPAYINNSVAKQYYSAIETFLIKNGVRVHRDPGADYTCPPKADFYVAHSRGCSREICMPSRGQVNDFLRFGDIGGYIHPVDEEWQRMNPPTGKYNPPPPEHFLFTAEQQQAIMAKIIEIKARRPAGTRQSPGRGRPSPRG